MIRLPNNSGVWVSGPAPDADDTLDEMFDQWCDSRDDEDSEDMEQRRTTWTSRRVGRFKREHA